ncbi:hypothetical protein CEK69_08780 [Xanthomonas sp. LMG 12462]|nr:hypothetical protein CEK69_08780 [Xanthomonas sp. LMG 12462]
MHHPLGFFHRVFCLHPRHALAWDGQSGNRFAQYGVDTALDELGGFDVEGSANAELRTCVLVLLHDNEVACVQAATESVGGTQTGFLPAMQREV